MARVFLCGALLAGGLLSCAGPALASPSLLHRHKATPTAPGPDSLDQAWHQLEKGAQAHRVDMRLKAINALSLLAGNLRAEAIIQAAIADKHGDVDIRVAALAAAAHMGREHELSPGLRGQLEALATDKDPKLSFAAASALWATKNSAGEPVLSAVAEGKRSAEYGLMKRSAHSASRTAHDPEAMAGFAFKQGASTLFPPLGVGMGLYSYIKGGSGLSPQVLAIQELAHTHSDSVEATLIAASQSKQVPARVAATEALATFRNDQAHRAVFLLTGDSDAQVRLTASAAFINTAPAEVVTIPEK